MIDDERRERESIEARRPAVLARPADPLQLLPDYLPGDRAFELYPMLSPLTRARTPEEVERYRVEPYVVGAYVYTAAGQVGRRCAARGDRAPAPAAGPGDGAAASGGRAHPGHPSRGP